MPWEANLPNFVRSSSNFLIPRCQKYKIWKNIIFFFRLQNSSTREKIWAKDLISIQKYKIWKNIFLQNSSTREKIRAKDVISIQKYKIWKNIFLRFQNSSTREKIRAKGVISIQRKLKSIKYEKIFFYKIRLRIEFVNSKV